MKQKRINNILVPVLCPSELKTVLKQATFFHEAYSAKITLLLVTPRVSIVNRMFNPNQNSALLEKREAFTRLTLNTGAFYNNDIPNFITIKVEENTFVSQIKKELKSNEYDLVIIKECSKVGSLLSKLQALSEKLISRIDCPVMIVHEEWTKAGINEILIPIDITKKCKDTILWAIAQSKNLGAKLKFVAIVNTKINIRESLIYQRSILINNWINMMGVDCSFHIIKSTPNKMAKTLLNYANKGNFDLIMILTHEEFIASNNYLGKFAKEIIHQSPKPVISMSTQNRPMFKIISGFNASRKNRMERLNLSKNELVNYSADRNVSRLKGYNQKYKTTIGL